MAKRGRQERLADQRGREGLKKDREAGRKGGAISDIAITEGGEIQHQRIWDQMETAARKIAAAMSQLGDKASALAPFKELGLAVVGYDKKLTVPDSLESAELCAARESVIAALAEIKPMDALGTPGVLRGKATIESALKTANGQISVLLKKAAKKAAPRKGNHQEEIEDHLRNQLHDPLKTKEPR